MTTHSDAPQSRPRVRPVTWAILAWMIIMIAAILGAWQGSESRHGALPTFAVATDREHVEVLPFTATDLDGNTYNNPVTEFPARDSHTLTVRLPAETHDSALEVLELRADGVREYTVEPGGPGQLLIPVTTEDEGRIEGLVIRTVAIVYDQAGAESILSGEWSIGIVYTD